MLTASAASHHNNMDSLHGQLGRLLNDAQALLADIAPGASGSQFGEELLYLEQIQNCISFWLFTSNHLI